MADVDRIVDSVYPLIDPKPHFSSQTYKGKVVIITGGSTGIGGTAALFYAKAGAHVIINARSADKLEARKAAIEKEVPNAQVVVAAGDIVDPAVSKSMVQTAVEKWGKVDIVLANSGMAYTSPQSAYMRFAWFAHTLITFQSLTPRTP